MLREPQEPKKTITKSKYFYISSYIDKNKLKVFLEDSGDCDIDGVFNSSEAYLYYRFVSPNPNYEKEFAEYQVLKEAYDKERKELKEAKEKRKISLDNRLATLYTRESGVINLLFQKHKI